MIWTHQEPRGRMHYGTSGSTESIACINWKGGHGVQWTDDIRLVECRACLAKVQPSHSGDERNG